MGKRTKTLNDFLKIRRDQYLVRLRKRSQTRLKLGRKVSDVYPNVGDVIQVKDNLPRGSWRIGRIVEFVTSRDGHTRSAKVQLCNKRVIGHPLNLLFPLELNIYASDVINKVNEIENCMTQNTTKPKRKQQQLQNKI